MRLLIIFLGLSAFPFPAISETGNQLYNFCGEPDGSFGSVYCSGYTAAIVKVLESNSINGFSACFPQSGVTYGQIEDIVYAYLNKNPELRHFAASGLFAEALSEAFPC